MSSKNREKMTPRVREILSWYPSDNPSVLWRLGLLFKHGIMSGTGKLILADLSGGIDRGPAESFANNVNGFDPNYLFDLAYEAGASAVIAPQGILDFTARSHASDVMSFLKCDHNVVLSSWQGRYASASVDKAIQLGCLGVCLTLSVGSDCYSSQISKASEVVELARSKGLICMASIQRHGQVEDDRKKESLPIDQASHAVHLASQLGFHIIETPHVDLPTVKLREWYMEKQVPYEKAVQRYEHVLQSAMQKQKIVIARWSSHWSEEQKQSHTQDWTSAGCTGINLGSHFYNQAKNEVRQEVEKVREYLLGV